MFEPIFHKFVTGSAAVVFAFSAYQMSQAATVFTIMMNEKMNRVDSDMKRVADAVERGMNKYAPPKR